MPKRTVVADWSDVVQYAEQSEDAGSALDPAYIFRGHEDETWTLQPSLHRAVLGSNRTRLPAERELLYIESALTEQFQSVAWSHLPAALAVPGLPRNQLDWWLLMRHYGVPTRVLDWTKSLYVAVYFAASRSPDKNGIVYALRAEALEGAMAAAHGRQAKILNEANEFEEQHFLKPGAPPVVCIMRGSGPLPDRVIVQQAMFMACRNVRADIESELVTQLPRVAKKHKGGVLSRLVIPGDLKPTVMRRLRAMNITASSLFPGLDGIGRHLDELIRYRD